MGTKYTCDKCGIVIPQSDNLYKMFAEDRGTYWFQSFELCGKCGDSVMKFMNATIKG